MYNNYTPYGYQQYGYQPNYFQTQQTQKQSYPQQQVMAVQDVPFNDVKFVTEDEAKAYIVMPNMKVMLMDRDKSVFYIKSADSMGKSTLEGFRYSKLEDNSQETQNAQNDSKNWLTKDDLSNFITIDDIKEFSTKEETKEISTRITSLENEIKKLNKLSELLGGNDGR